MEIQKTKPSKYERLTTKKAVGMYGENFACNRLMLKGHKILARNYRSRRCEIDIISEYKDSIYFTEVKTRRCIYNGTPTEAVDYDKISRMQKAADIWLRNNNITQSKDVRTNVIGIELKSNGKLTVDEFLVEAL
jgi:putative endonuclease